MNRSAFTVLELLLAIALSGLVLGALAPALFGVIRGQRQAERVLGPLADRQVMIARLRDDVLSIRVDGTLAQPVQLATTATAQGITAPTLSFLATTAPPLPPTWAIRPPTIGQALITWTVQPSDDETSLALTRSAQVHLLATGTPPAPVPEIVLDGLSSVSFEVLIRGEWFTTYDSGTSNGAIRPEAVRLRVSSHDGPQQVWCIDLPQAVGDGT